jgi:hypothetical protein
VSYFSPDKVKAFERADYFGKRSEALCLTKKAALEKLVTNS